MHQQMQLYFRFAHAQHDKYVVLYFIYNIMQN